MEGLTIDFVEWIEMLPLASIYLAFFLVAYLENVIPPVPGDILVVFAGYLAVDGTIDFTTVLMITTLASVMGFMSMYYIGYRWGDGIKNKRGKFWLFKYVNFKYMTRAQAWMNRWGQWVVVGNRFLAGTRSIISLISGISQTPVSLTMLNSFISSLLWNFILLGAGWFINENWEDIGRYLSIYSWVIIAGISLFVGYKFWGFWQRRKNKKAVRKN
jgi:membrane protein DedA with SNARE-associated domain